MKTNMHIFLGWAIQKKLCFLVIDLQLIAKWIDQLTWHLVDNNTVMVWVLVFKILLALFLSILPKMQFFLFIMQPLTHVANFLRWKLVTYHISISNDSKMFPNAPALFLQYFHCFCMFPQCSPVLSNDHKYFQMSQSMRRVHLTCKVWH